MNIKVTALPHHQRQTFTSTWCSVHKADTGIFLHTSYVNLFLQSEVKCDSLPSLSFMSPGFEVLIGECIQKSVTTCII